MTCQVIIADEASNHTKRSKLPVSRWLTAGDLKEMVMIDMANSEYADFSLYLISNEHGKRS